MQVGDKVYLKEEYRDKYVDGDYVTQPIIILDIEIGIEVKKSNLSTLIYGEWCDGNSEWLHFYELMTKEENRKKKLERICK